ncbi:single-stranded DNA-binding protein [Homoserinibacter sp. GY 40078]|uniref:single-stranded DNA-binding protein n=1 Tax=Homoserinibacter sp. GY 40078 TaxID=2603275 RepID=UPI0011C8B861|nr:single-stranded DNA-binding protein [Homoserinibacter sp. GY 40078]TXK19644.1 single-stranded DNA-binding protein [Homoserinibacter sp. GY 40078]
MTDIVTVVGFVATAVKHTVTAEGLEIASFRLASTHRRFDRTANAWVDGQTNWFSITAFRQLAANASASIDKGQRVIVTGRLRVREWTSGEKSGHDVEIVADAIGHDLAWGTTTWTRTVRASAEPDHASETDEAQAGELSETAALLDDAQEAVPVPF